MICCTRKVVCCFVAFFFCRTEWRNVGGYFYFCGQAGAVPTAVRSAVVKSFVKAGGMTPEEAEKAVQKMETDGRYCVEAW